MRACQNFMRVNCENKISNNNFRILIEVSSTKHHINIWLNPERLTSFRAKLNLKLFRASAFRTHSECIENALKRNLRKEPLFNVLILTQNSKLPHKVRNVLSRKIDYPHRIERRDFRLFDSFKFNLVQNQFRHQMICISTLTNSFENSILRFRKWDY